MNPFELPIFPPKHEPKHVVVKVGQRNFIQQMRSNRSIGQRFTQENDQ